MSLCQIFLGTLLVLVAVSLGSAEDCSTKVCPPNSSCEDANGQARCIDNCPPSCDLQCDYGKETDENGCEVCKCKENIPCPPQCRMYCEHGKERDENGCEVCQCKPPPPFPRTRPPLPSAQNVLPSSQANQNTNTNVYGEALTRDLLVQGEMSIIRQPETHLTTGFGCI